MQIAGRLIFCSALATILIYTLYRRRRKRNTISVKEPQTIHCPFLPETPVCCAKAEEDSPLEQCVEFVACELPTVAKVSLCYNLHQPPQGYIPVTSITMLSCQTEYPTLEPIIMSSSNIECQSPGSSGSGSLHAHTPDSRQSTDSPDHAKIFNLPPGCFNDPINDIYEDDPEYMNGTMVPKVLIPSDLWAEAVDQDIWRETFCVPAHMGGVLIGRLGKNVRELKNIWQADFSLNNCPGRQDTLLFKLACPIKNKDDVLQWVSRRFRMRPSRTSIGNPNQLKRYLPLGELVPVYVRSLYAAKEFFVTIRDAEYPKYLKLQSEIDRDYSAPSNFRMQLCEPVTSGTVAIVPHSQGFARALIISVYATWPKTALYFLLDHGTFGVAPLNKLKKIRAKYMRTSFQAIHVNWAHAFPVFFDIPDVHILRTFFNSNRLQAFAVRMETCCRASVTFGEPYPPPYSTSGLMDVLVNACNSGLYMTVPLIIYPSRQCWLNMTDTPYYPFNYSPINYPALVSFVAEEGPVSPVIECEKTDDSTEYGQQEQTVAPQFVHPPRTTRGGFNARRPYGWNPRFARSRGRNQKSPAFSQKENENSIDRPSSENTKNVPTSACRVNCVEPRRKPLGVQNARGSSGPYRGPCSSFRGRGNGNRFRE